MSNARNDRAEARRRARLAARSGSDDETLEPAEAEPAEARLSLLRRLFPSAPPLPGRPPPLEGFRYEGRLRPVAERLWLVGRMPLAWLIPGVLWFVGSLVGLIASDAPFGFFISFLAFGAPLAAGWFGWRRPPLYGAATSLLGYLLLSGYLIYSLSSQGAGPTELGGPQAIALELGRGILLYGAIGYAMGWYGGYLRRRQAAARIDPPRRRR